ncbi:DoxX family protein [Micromonospora sp. NBC_00858]|uniref:DoxX family protein n=1 Tax=Micromonospora sp. NBC_00858 TaxID=2975979 RepID=UPI00386A0B03|nr:DoxX family membrane protein [Micromonospora sp. NBC_00858]
MVNVASGHETSTPITPLATTERPVLGTGREPGTTRRGIPGSTVAPDTAFTVTGRAATATRYLLAGIRLALGWVFLWAFLDKLFGLGQSTVSGNAWLNGGSPTAGFLGKAATGPFTGFYHSIAGSAVADVLFMAALLGIGAALILGIGMRIAAAAGALLTVLMWTAVLPPASNPFMDDHLIYAAVLIVLALLGAGNTWGFGRMWAATPFVRRNTWLN